MDVENISGKLLRRIWIIALVPLVVGLAAYFLTKEAKNGYRSTAQMDISEFINGPGTSERDIETFMTRLRSEPIASMVAYQLLLHDLNEDIPFRNRALENQSLADRNSLINRLKANLLSFRVLSTNNRLDGRILELLNRNGYRVADWIRTGDLSLQRDDVPSVITAEFQSENPFLSAFVVNTFCEECIRYGKHLEDGKMTTQGTDSSYRLTAYIAEKKQIAEELEDKLEKVKTEYEVSRKAPQSPDRGTNQLLLRKAEEQVNDLRALLGRLNTEIAEMERSGLSSAESVDHNVKLADLEKRIQELESIYSEGGASNKELGATIRRLRDQLRTERARLTVETKKAGDHLKDLNTQRSELEGRYAEAQQAVEQLNQRIRSKKNEEFRDPTKESMLRQLQKHRDSAWQEYARAADTNRRKIERPVLEQNSEIAAGILVRGQPNADPEAFDSSLIGIAVAGSFVISIFLVLFSSSRRQETYVDFPGDPNEFLPIKKGENERRHRSRELPN